MKIEEVKVNIACLDKGKNSCMNNCVKPKSKANLGKQTQVLFVPTCHHCGIVGHIKPNCCQLEFQRPWNNEKYVVEPSISKYVPPYRRQPSQRFVPTCHHCGVIGHIRLHYPQICSQKPRIKKQEPKKGKSGTGPSKIHHAPRQQRQYPQRFVPTCCHCGKTGHNKSDCFKLKPHKLRNNLLYEGLLSIIKNVLSILDKLDMVHNPVPRVKKVWVKKDVPFTS
jgi:hypothetical protein